MEVEESIIRRDSKIVGGYDIVPLSQLLVEFEGWDRRLDYLSRLADFLLLEDVQITGALVINRLRKDIYTGFPDLEEIALHLLKIAEMTWLRQVSTWVLYGRLPSFGAADFFVVEGEANKSEEDVGLADDVVLKQFHLNRTLIPEFVDPQTASSIMFIGKALSHIRSRSGASSRDLSISSSEITPVSVHLSHLQSLQSPFSSQRLSSVTAAIRLSLSKNTLQTLLPAQKIVEIIHVFREFYLLGRGEFAMALIQQSAESVKNRFRRLPGTGGQQEIELVSTPAGQRVSVNVSIKEGEVAAILTRTWGIISSYASEDFVDERLDVARDLLHLTLVKPNNAAPSAKKTALTKFNDILIGVPISLGFHLSWPLELFLSSFELDRYDMIFSYLLSVRKAQLQVQSLWRGRRPLPDMVPAGPEESKARRARNREREIAERELWASASLASFFLETIVGYFQGEVIQPAYEALMVVLRGDSPDDKSRPVSRAGPEEDKPVWLHTSSDQTTDTEKEKTRDPETLTIAHGQYILGLQRNLFLEDAKFPALLRDFILATETLVADMERLYSRRALRDLDLNDHMSQVEEARDVGRARDSCQRIKSLITGLVDRLHHMDEERGLEEDTDKSGKIDRLLMRLGLSQLRESGQLVDSDGDEEMEDA